MNSNSSLGRIHLNMMAHDKNQCSGLMEVSTNQETVHTTHCGNSVAIKASLSQKIWFLIFYPFKICL